MEPIYWLNNLCTPPQVVNEIDSYVPTHVQYHQFNLSTYLQGLVGVSLKVWLIRLFLEYSIPVLFMCVNNNVNIVNTFLHNNTVLPVDTVTQFGVTVTIGRI